MIFKGHGSIYRAILMLIVQDVECIGRLGVIVFYVEYVLLSGFGGLGVACWPLVPKFAGSNPTEVIGFLRGEKNPQHAFLRRGSKAVGPMS